MTSALLIYSLIAYYYFHLVLRSLQPYDTPSTAILNTSLALTIGPLILIPAIIVGFIDRVFKR